KGAQKTLRRGHPLCLCSRDHRSFKGMRRTVGSLGAVLLGLTTSPVVLAQQPAPGAAAPVPGAPAPADAQPSTVGGSFSVDANPTGVNQQEQVQSPPAPAPYAQPPAQAQPYPPPYPQQPGYQQP